MGAPVRVEVPKRFPGATVVIIGGGPSLTRADVDYCRDRAVVIAVNDAYRLAGWADVLYACDAKWWGWHQGVPGFRGLKYSIDRSARNYPGVQILEHTGTDGLELRPWGLRSGKNSGYQAVNLAVHLGAARIVLLGFDMQLGASERRDHWFGAHPGGGRPGVDNFRVKFETIVGPLRRLGIDIVNCSRRTALACIRRAPLGETLGEAGTGRGRVTHL